MRADPIEEIGIDAAGQLLVKPATQQFLHIWRSGAEVHWNAEHCYLFSPKPREWFYLHWYQHIIEVARDGDGGGVDLRLTSATRWINLPDELRQEIQALSPLL